MRIQQAQTPNVFLVDDDGRIRSSLARALGKRGYSVSTFASAESFLRAYDPAEPGCLVLDYGMPGLNGLELQEHLNTRKYAIPVIFISGHGGISESVQAMKGGAVDFLEKPFRQTTLIACIDAALSADRAKRSAQTQVQSARERFSQLTAREQEIASLIIADPSNTSSKEIGRQLDISPRTVDHHRARILEKMAVNSVAQLIDLSATAALQQQAKPRGVGH